MSAERWVFKCAAGHRCEAAEAIVAERDAEIDRLRAALTVANNRLGNAVGALIDAGTYCTGVDDVTAGIDRLRAEREAWEAFRQTVNCPSCGGSNHHWRVKCDDCTDGHPPMARLLRIAVLTLTVDPDRHTFPSQQALLDYLRQVRP